MKIHDVGDDFIFLIDQSELNLKLIEIHEDRKETVFFLGGCQRTKRIESKIFAHFNT